MPEPGNEAVLAIVVLAVFLDERALHAAEDVAREYLVLEAACAVNVHRQELCTLNASRAPGPRALFYLLGGELTGAVTTFLELIAVLSVQAIAKFISLGRGEDLGALSQLGRIRLLSRMFKSCAGCVSVLEFLVIQWAIEVAVGPHGAVILNR